MEVIIVGGGIFLMAASRFVENAIPRKAKHATKFRMTLFKVKM